MTRVLTPGGRIAILTSCRLQSAAGRTVNDLVGARSGMRIFEPDEIVDGAARAAATPRSASGSPG